MKNNTKIVAVLGTLALCGAGCMTSITTPNGWKYSSFGFTKHIDTLALTQTASNVFSLRVKGYETDAADASNGWSNLLVSLAPLIARGVQASQVMVPMAAPQPPAGQMWISPDGKVYNALPTPMPNAR